MKGLKLTKGLISSLPNGEYAIFKDNILQDLVSIENTYDDGSLSDYPIGAILGSDEIYTEESFLKKFDLSENYIIINKEFVKL